MHKCLICKLCDIKQKHGKSCSNLRHKLKVSQTLADIKLIPSSLVLVESELVQIFVILILFIIMHWIPSFSSYQDGELHWIYTGKGIRFTGFYGSLLLAKKCSLWKPGHFRVSRTVVLDFCSWINLLLKDAIQLEIFWRICLVDVGGEHICGVELFSVDSWRFHGCSAHQFWFNDSDEILGSAHFILFYFEFCCLLHTCRVIITSAKQPNLSTGSILNSILCFTEAVSPIPWRYPFYHSPFDCTAYIQFSSSLHDLLTVSICLTSSMRLNMKFTSYLCTYLGGTNLFIMWLS